MIFTGGGAEFDAREKNLVGAKKNVWPPLKKRFLLGIGP